MEDSQLSTCTFEKGGNVEGLGRLYLRGVVMNVMNPKVSLFFLAFLPQFTDPTAGNVTLQIAILGLLFMLSALVVFGAISLFAGSIGGRLRSGRSGKILHKLSAGIFAGLAIKLLLSEK